MSLHFFSGLPYLLPPILPRGSGQKQKLKAASAGDKEGTPPRWVPWRQGEPATKKASPRRAPLTLVEPVPRPAQPPGKQGAKPLA